VTAFAVTLALLSAATFAISTSVQHQAAEGAPDSAKGLLGLLGYLVRRPAWLVGQFLATCAFVLHASALHAGPIAVVQPIVVSGIVWAVPARAALNRRMPSLTELRTIAFAVVGVAIAVAANVLASRVRGDPRRKAFFLGVVGGVLFGLVAGFVKLTLQELNDGGVDAMLTAWPTYALVLAGVGGVLTNQRAYRVAGLSASMPALNIVNGMTSLALGFTLFTEVPRHSPLFLLVEGIALGCMAVGLWMLIKLEEAHLVEEVADPEVATDRRT
jgi:drug/metabolite transporter (DMT)-like permease